MNIVYQKDVNESGTIDNRVAEIDGKFFPYQMNYNTAQITRGRAFAGHTEEGVKYVSEPYQTKEAAIKALD